MDYTATTLNTLYPAQVKVLRNTYQLLAMAIGVTAITAGLSSAFNTSPLVGLCFSLLSFVPLIVLQFKKDSALAVPLLLLFTGLIGAGLGPTIGRYANLPGGPMIVMQAAVISLLIMVSLTFYVIKTGKDFTQLGGILMAGLIAVIVGSIAAIFFPVLQVAVSAVSALLFAAYILYDTSRIIRGEETNYVIAACSLFLNILNLFTALLRLLTSMSNDD